MSTHIYNFISFFVKNLTALLKYNSYNTKFTHLNYPTLGFPGGTVVENLPANAGDMGSSPGLGRSHMPQSN